MSLEQIARDMKLGTFPNKSELTLLEEEIVRLRAALQFIADGYDNHDVNHVDFRVKAYQVALDALALPNGERNSG